MLNTIFNGLFDTAATSVVSTGTFLLCVGTALLIGLVIAAVHMYRTRYTKSFLISLALLPALVTVVIMMVNGNVGTGVAVAGAFSLVRFRSAPGTAKEIVSLFMAMGSGLITGMGYLGYAALFTLTIGAASLLYTRFNFGTKRNAGRYKTLRMTVPEDLDYTDVFNEPMQRYTSDCRLTQVKTTQMGSLFRLTYDVTLRDTDEEKAFIDALRCRNGNLEIVISDQETIASEL